MSRSYQRNHAELYPETLNFEQRRKKANKVVRILDHASGRSLQSKCCLEIGSSGGGMSPVFAQHFRFVVAGDIDAKAVAAGAKINPSPALAFATIDGMNLPFREQTIDVVICNHVYEHVPDARRLMAEIRRVLVDGGLCYFACGNRFTLFDGDHHLPFLTLLPGPLADRYLRLMGRGDHYYERPLFYWQLRDLVRAFSLTDYTWKVLTDPESFADDVGSPAIAAGIRLVPGFLRRLLYPFVPTYLWVLEKGKPPL